MRDRAMENKRKISAVELVKDGLILLLTCSALWLLAQTPLFIRVIRPWWRSTISLAMDSPRPVPPDWRERALSTR